MQTNERQKERLTLGGQKDRVIKKTKLQKNDRQKERKKEK